MLAQERYQIILDHLGAEGAATVPELSVLLNASQATVRRDLNVLAKEGRLNKVFGGATSIRQMGLREERVQNRELLMLPEKDAIARYAATHLSPDGLLFFECNALSKIYLPSKTAYFNYKGYSYWGDYENLFVYPN